ncbi:MAG: (2Fe-2S)-binding protein [Nitrososphaerota archaeon]|jgi:carbon-monoxide dehydrogenase small subunit|nr:(2Fe-2S)-binding protein [Nitrososphaerota archaeon]MDG6927430.1 (2Fe-2S)-binding protein [Nitrososphaerota archaeon]MDG6931234.1 (2Fe-2S)-binding protein [Nitrososphaerota archaeon]MDG6931897.1 (2Fe-2S)-binding protein [Nitrososphaerota archaeon]MDG6936583.1 (2Fe-2S)-binding protein [Nitrososphaerota archaeon]
MKVKINVNGEDFASDVEPRLLLVDFLRDTAGLTGTHVGCETGSCGSCTVLLDGRPVKSCLMLAAQADGSRIITIEGISKGESMNRVQKSLSESKALQCGFCAPGIVITASWFLDKNENPDEGEIREALSGNICRCTGYQPVVDAVLKASKEVK